MRYVLHLIVAVALTSMTSAVFASDGPGEKPDCRGRCIVRCPNCCHDCVFSANKENVDKTFYDVACKDICIPRILFPWQKGCCSCAKGGKDGDGKGGCCAVHNGAKTKSVRVLKKYKYECSECKHKWTPVPKGSAGKKVIKRIEFDSKDDVPPPPVAKGMIYGKPIVERTVSHSR